MKANTHILESNTLIASATGIGSIGAAMFGVPGAIVGIVLGFGFGYYSESKSQLLEKEGMPPVDSREKTTHRSVADQAYRSRVIQRKLRPKN